MKPSARSTPKIMSAAQTTAAWPLLPALALTLTLGLAPTLTLALLPTLTLILAPMLILLLALPPALILTMLWPTQTTPALTTLPCRRTFRALARSLAARGGRTMARRTDPAALAGSCTLGSSSRTTTSPTHRVRRVRRRQIRRRWRQHSSPWGCHKSGRRVPGRARHPRHWWRPNPRRSRT